MVGEPPKSLNESLVWETKQLPWDVVQSKAQIGLAGKLRRQATINETPPLAATLAKLKMDPHQAPVARENRFLEQASKLAAAWNMAEVPPASKHRYLAWKRRLHAQAHQVSWRSGVKSLVTRKSAVAQGGDQADKVYVQGVDISQSAAAGATAWREWVPHQKDRVAVRRLRMGLIEGLKPSAALPVVGWNTLPSEAQETLLLCPCGRGIQDPAHVVTSCGRTENLRAEVLAHMEAAVMAVGNAQDKEKLMSMDQHQRVMHTLQSVPRFSEATERSIRGHAARLWRSGISSLSSRLMTENVDVTAETTASVAKAAISG